MNSRKTLKTAVDAKEIPAVSAISPILLREGGPHILENAQPVGVCGARKQKAGDIRRDDPVLMARFVWALVHGTAMLVIDGQMRPSRRRGSVLPQPGSASLWGQSPGVQWFKANGGVEPLQRAGL